MRKERKHFTPEEKVATLRRHLVDKEPVSELCEELGLRPTVFYRWQKELFENGAAAFQSQERPRREVEEKQKRIEFLEKKVQTKDEVLAELMAEHIALKKSLGVAAMLAGSLAGESPAGGSLPSYPRSDIRRRRG
jgi:transposase